MRCARRVRAGVCGCAEFAIGVALAWHAYHSRDKFSEVVPEGLLLTAQLEGFWGPVQVVIPTTCSPPFYARDGAVDKNQSDGRGVNVSRSLQSEHNNLRRASTANRSTAPLDDRESPSGPGGNGSNASSGAVEDMESRENETHHIVHLKHCQRTVVVKKITRAQHYFGMVWLGGASSVEELKSSRWWAFLVMTCLACRGLAEGSYAWSGPCVDLQNEGPRTTRPGEQQYQLLEDNPLADALGTCLCSPCLFLCDVFNKANLLLLFIMFWHDASGVFVLNYFQGRFFIITIASLVCFCVLPIWLFVLGIPVLVYIPYQCQFMWKIIMAESLYLNDFVVNDTSLTNFMLEENIWVKELMVWVLVLAGADIVSEIFAGFLDARKVNPA